METLTQIAQEEKDFLIMAYDLFNKREIEPLISLMTPDVEWPNGMEGGYIYGREKLRKYWTWQWDFIDPFVDPLSITRTPDGRVAVDVHQVIKDKNGKTMLDQIVKHIYHFENMKIKHMEIDHQA